MYTEQFRSVTEKVYQYLYGFDKAVPEDLTLKELIELMVNEYRTDSEITNKQMAMNIYSTCVGALASKDIAFRLIINEEGVDCQVNLNGGSVYL